MKMNLTQGGKQVDLNQLFSNSNFDPAPVHDALEHQRAMDKICSLVLVRERTAKEIRERLLSLDYDQDIVEEAVDSALRCGLIDEHRYASALIRGKVHQGWGRGKIEERLRKDGVSYSTIVDCAHLFSSPEEEYRRALHELEKKSVHSKNPRATLSRRLLAKGYSTDVTYRAVDEFISRSA